MAHVVRDCCGEQQGSKAQRWLEVGVGGTCSSGEQLPSPGLPAHPQGGGNIPSGDSRVLEAASSPTILGMFKGLSGHVAVKQ